MKKTLFLVVSLLLLLPAVTVFAAGGTEEVVEEVKASSFEGMTAIDRTKGWEVGKKGGRFVMSSFGSDPKSFNAVVAKETSTTDIVGQMYSSAFKRNQFTLEWENNLAESWTLSDDEKVLTVKLQDGLKWSDGEDFTAEDVVFTVNQIHMVDETGSRYQSGLYVGDDPTVWELVDRLTFKITFPTVYADPFSMASTLYYPKHIFEPLIEEKGPEAVASFWGVDTDVTKVVGNGPFVIKEYVPNQYVTMKPNPYYHLKDANGVQLPYIDEFVYVIVEDQDTQLEKFLAGELDFLGLRGEDYAVLVNRQEELDFTLYEVGPGSSTNFIAINQNPKEGEDDGGITPPQLTWLSTKKFRQALAHLVDRETVINNLQYGLGYPIYSFVPFTSPFYWDGLEDAALKFDPEAAKALLDEINYVDRDGDGFREDPEGNKISLTVRTNAGNSVREGMIEIFAQEAQSVGLDITARPEDFNSLVTRLVASYDWELIAIGLTGVIDPGLSNSVQPSYGELHMIEPLQETPRREWEAKLDKVWVENQTTTDFEKRKAALVEAQKIWLEELPMLYVFSTLVMHAYGNEWGNIYPQSPNGYSWDGILERIYIK